jgi:hypothetical protein
MAATEAVHRQIHVDLNDNADAMSVTDTSPTQLALLKRY